MGPAPYPTLLLEVLKGHVSQLELEQRLDEIEATKTTKLLKEIRVRCGQCNEDLYPTSFIRPEKNSASFLKSIIENILMLGACRVCLRCKVGFDEQLCFLCEEIRERRASS